MARVDLYRNVHKAQRAQLFGLAVELGRVDHGDRAARAALAGRLQAALAELREHAHHEESFIHPLLRARAPDAAAALEREHEAVERAFVEIEDGLGAFERQEAGAAAAQTELYRAWCRMLSAYLPHLDREEREAMPALWRTCAEDEILSVMQRFMASRSAAENLRDLCSQVPALAPQERALFVAGALRSGALAADRLWDGLAGVLPPGDLARLRVEVPHSVLTATPGEASGPAFRESRDPCDRSPWCSRARRSPWA